MTDGTTNEDHQRTRLLRAAREIMSLQKYCALITVGSNGRPSIRTMNPFPPEDDFTVWMATNSRCRKVVEIRDNPQVVLYYANHQDACGYVSISGKAILVNENEEKEKGRRDYWKEAFPDWRYLLLIQVIPERVEVINYQHNMLNDDITWQAPFHVISVQAP